MRTLQGRLAKISRKDWLKGSIWSILYIAFVIWVAWKDWASLGWLVIVPVIMDAFTTKFINWGWWRKYKDTKPQLHTICSWIDAIVFALVAVYFINLYFFQNYQIPSSSLEKTLRVGDFLFVDKMSYGPRTPNTPLSMPLMQHTWPVWLGGGKSYIENPHWEYKRLAGWCKPSKGDIIVFNFPAGDTVCTKMQNPDYYTLCHYYGTRAVHNRKDVFGEVVTRPVDRRENYVKRCVGIAGDSLKVVNNIVYTKSATDTAWVKEQAYKGVQNNYLVYTDGHVLTRTYLDKVGISHDDQRCLESGVYYFPLTASMKATLEKNPHVTKIEIEPEINGGDVYPLGKTDWTRDNYGPIYLPRRGERLLITEENYPIYRRIAQAYEHQQMVIGQEYTFSMDYFWMMGDNRHNSADSRYWGFVPEDHIVGRPVFVWLSIEKDRPWFKGHIRWNRIGHIALQ